MAEKKKAAEGGGTTATTTRQRMARVQWNPTGTSRAKFREIGPFRWGRNEILELPAEEWEQLRPKRLVTRDEEFKELTLAEVRELQEVQEAAQEEAAAEQLAEEVGEYVTSNPTPAAGE